MVPLRMLGFGVAIGGCMFLFLSFHQTAHHDYSRPLPESSSKSNPQFVSSLSNVTQMLQIMDQRVLSLEVQIQELGRSHSTSAGLLLRSPRRLGSVGRSSGSYKIAEMRIASAGTNMPAEVGHLPEMAIDHDDTTWMACNGCVWRGDLKSVVVLFSISIDWQTCDCADDASVKIEVSVASDGPWQLYANAGGFVAAGGHTRRSHVMMAEARYIRISLGETSTATKFAMWEVFVKTETFAKAITPPADSLRVGKIENSLDNVAVPGQTQDESQKSHESEANTETPKEKKKDEGQSAGTNQQQKAEEKYGGVYVAAENYRTDDKCGSRVAKLDNGLPVGCNPNGKYPCCSPLGWCGNSAAHCGCAACKDYRKLPNSNMPVNTLPSIQPQVDPAGGVTVAVIIPFRDRETHLVKFKPFWRQFAKEGIKPIRVKRWDIYLAEQFDSEPFNRGWNFNVGLAVASMQTSACEDITREMTSPFRCAAIQDIDYLPEPLVDYAECAVPMQLSAEIDRYDWKTPYMQSAGGIVSMNLGHWQQINGFSNDYFGWGGEDDELHHRLRLVGLLYGDCYPFCKPDDPSKGKAGLSIKRPPKGHGRFSGKMMHSANHTKRITDSRAYETNLKLLAEIHSGNPRWKKDGLSNLAFRIVQYEKDTTDLEEYGITYHHVKSRRGRNQYNPRDITIVVPTSVCASSVKPYRWRTAKVSTPLPWTLEALRSRVHSILKDDCGAPWNAKTFIMVDLRSHLAKLLSDDNPDMLIAFYRGLVDPAKDGLIVVDPRPATEVREAFHAVGARVHPPTEYSICFSKLAGGELKYSLHQGPACAGGWDKSSGGTFWAFAEKKPDKVEVTFCDNSRYWVQRMLKDGECEKEWKGLKWSQGGRFWVPKGKQFCVGHREGGEVAFSAAAPQEDCSFNNVKHAFSFGSALYEHLFGSFTLCISRKGDSTKLAIETHCDEDAYTPVIKFRARLPSKAASTDRELCINDKSSKEILETCEAHLAVRFAVPRESVSDSQTVVCAGPLKSNPSRKAIGYGDECRTGPGQKIDPNIMFPVPSLADVAASAPQTGESAYPFFTLAEEEVACASLFCRNAIDCAKHKNIYYGKACIVTS